MAGIHVQFERYHWESEKNYKYKICRSGHLNGQYFKADLDEAQALCMVNNAGDALGNDNHQVITDGHLIEDCRPECRRPENRRKPECRRCLKSGDRAMKLKCSVNPKGLEDCDVEQLPKGTQCYELKVDCYKNFCWRQDNTVKVSDGYGQRCIPGGGCSENCYRCSLGSWDASNCWGRETRVVPRDALVIWEPHFVTFDGTHFDFQGQCSYTLIKAAFTEVIGKYEICGKQDVTCLESLTINTGTEQKISLKLGPKRKYELRINGTLQVIQKPYCNDFLCFYDASSSHDAVDLLVGIKILWDRKADARYTVSPLNKNHLSGLMGNFNGNKSDDFMKPDGTLAQTPEEFGESWMVEGSCAPGVAGSGHAPVITRGERIKAEKHCKVIKGEAFAKCNHTETKKNAYNDCIMDVATCSQTDLSTCLCPSIRELADDCDNAGIMIEGWEEHMPECMPKKCPEGQIFQACANPCEVSCKVKNHAHVPCIHTCVEGCNCPPGQSKDENGKCILTTDCPK